jgi:hypothetical protein
MNDDEKQAWRDHAKQMNNMRNARRYQFKEVIADFERMGFEVKEVSPFQYRFNDCVDIFPSNKRFYDLKTRERGDIRGKNLNQFLREYFGLAVQ